MARLTRQQIADEIKSLGYELIDDSKYINMQSKIIIKCSQGHLIETCLADVRKPSFTCPVCDKDISFINPKEVPQKGNAYRVIAFDQATEKFGLSIFDDGQLVFYRLFTFGGSMNARLLKIKKMIDEIIIPEWKPDFIQMEDIQYQSNGFITFKVLAMLLGVIQTVCEDHGVKYDTVAPNVWRKYAGTNGANRREEKMLSVAMVREKYDIKVSDDVAEAILIGRYGAMMHKKTDAVEMAFGKRN